MASVALGCDEDLAVRVERQAVAVLLVGGDRGAQLGDAGARRVLVAAAVAQRPYGRLADLLGAVRVGEALAEVDRAGRRGQRGHLREDRGPELGETAVEQGARAGGHGRHPAPNLWSSSTLLRG